MMVANRSNRPAPKARRRVATINEGTAEHVGGYRILPSAAFLQPLSRSLLFDVLAEAAALP